MQVRNIKQALAASPRSAQPARVIWTSTMDTQPTQFDRTLEDWQLVKTPYSYELSKFETELVATRLNAAYRLPSQGGQADTVGSGTAVSPEIRHFITHPGVTATNVFAVIGWFLDWWMRVAFYLVSRRPSSIPSPTAILTRILSPSVVSCRHGG